MVPIISTSRRSIESSCGRVIAALAAADAGADLLIYALHVVGQLDGDDSSVEYALHHAAK
jgi:hypothetical protein